MWKIGNIEINGRIVLGPMAGFTSEGYRKYMNSFGCALCVTEMVSDMGIIYGNAETKSYITYKKDNIPTAVQLFGHDPKNMAEAAVKCLEINPDIEIFDINMGCPVNKVTKAGSGSALMQDPKNCGDIVRAIKETTGKPVTAKIRLGFNDINFMEVIHELEASGVDAIALHARTRKELYYGEPHYELIKDLRGKMNVPLIISGNIFTVEDALKALEITGAEAVMIARGGIGNPELISNIKSALNSESNLLDYIYKKQRNYCVELAKSMVEEKGEILGMRVYRSIAPKFFSGFANSKSLRTKLASQMTTFDSMISILDEFESNMSDI